MQRSFVGSRSVMKLFKRLPELQILLITTLGCYVFLEMYVDPSQSHVISSLSGVDLIITSFVLSVVIAIVAVIAGVGGGVIFTPLMLAFTSIDTLIIRSTGLVVAMFSGLVATGPFMRKGLADIKLVFLGALPILIGGLLGSFAAIFMSKHLGETGDYLVRLSLGLLLLGIASVFVLGGASTEYPEKVANDRLGRKLKLRHTYWEDSLQMPVKYKAQNVPLAMLLFLVVGFTGGFFGLGGGWAVVPVLNLVMSVPLKVSAATSGVLLAMGNSAAIWPYINIGALIGVVAAPWMLGQIIGGIIGAHILVSIKAAFVRKMLIIMLFVTSIKLISRGLEGLLGFNTPIF
ncbi:MAG: permease [SAR116 cluster bacterium]|nr:permease [SAR116 cluster bacterium]